MIAYLAGKILSIDLKEKAIVIVIPGIGYKVSINTDTLSKIQIGQPIELFIHTAVRENDIALYGFAKKEELSFFEQLTSVSGIGPKTALEILNTPLHITQNAIINEDADTLTKIKGIGRKTAERVIVELKTKIVPKELSGLRTPSGIAHEEVMIALEDLGYDRLQIMKNLSQLPPEIHGTEAIIKYFLKGQSK